MRKKEWIKSVNEIYCNSLNIYLWTLDIRKRAFSRGKEMHIMNLWTVLHSISEELSLLKWRRMIASNHSSQKFIFSIHTRTCSNKENCLISVFYPLANGSVHHFWGWHLPRKCYGNGRGKNWYKPENSYRGT